ncbi:Phosphatidylinositol transfer protein (PITP) [Collariella sp. IMI 366227]|nr:Phosphatidylinositol transfer protein (PITP) [Collariella sp. IMI 366227]
MPYFIRSHKQPAVPGLDFTARVEDVWRPDGSTGKGGDGAGRGRGWVCEGDEVVCLRPWHARYVVKIPKGKTLRAAAGLLPTACTAKAQVDDARLEEGQRVLVIGASGGVGTMAVQMVREKVVDYTLYKDLPSELARRFGEKKFDAVLDTFGNQAVYKRCAQYLKPEGLYSAASVHYDDYTFWKLMKSGLTIMANSIWPKTPWLGGTGRTWKAVSMMDPGMDMMEGIVKMFGENKLRVVVDSEWPFEKAHDALDVLATGHAAGKVLIKVNEDKE